MVTPEPHPLLPSPPHPCGTSHLGNRERATKNCWPEKSPRMQRISYTLTYNKAKSRVFIRRFAWHCLTRPRILYV